MYVVHEPGHWYLEHGPRPLEHLHGDDLSRADAQDLAQDLRHDESLHGQAHDMAREVDHAAEIGLRELAGHRELAGAVAEAKPRGHEADGLGAHHPGQSAHLVKSARRGRLREVDGHVLALHERELQVGQAAHDVDEHEAEEENGDGEGDPEYRGQRSRRAGARGCAAPCAWSG